jgi:hypothetical protein
MRVRQGHVPTAYVKAGLTVVLYVRQSRGFEEASRSHVWRLKKALYGLELADREWNFEIINFSSSMDSVNNDTCVYTHPTSGLIVLTYVHGILIAHHDEQMLER